MGNILYHAPKNKTDLKLTPRQFDVISKIGEGATLYQKGQQKGYLVEAPDKLNGIQNYLEPICVPRPTIKVLLKKGLISIKKREGMLKWFVLSERGERSLLSLVN